MAENSKIEWTDHTINWWIGCTKVSPACSNCYAESLDRRFAGQGAGHWGPDAPRAVRILPAAREAFRYQRRAEKEGRRFKVFTNSLADFFEDRMDLRGPRLEALDVMLRTPALDWLILTKRPERILDLLHQAFGAISSPCDLSKWIGDWLAGHPPANVWIGTTVEDQERANLRIPELLRVPAALRFLSMEPLLGPVDLTSLCCEGPHGELDALRGTFDDGDLDTPIIRGPKLDWVIVGGESGPHARPLHPAWAVGIRDQCAAAGTPFLFKQWGDWVPVDQPWAQDSPADLGTAERWVNLAGGHGFHGDDVWRMRKVGKARAGRLLDGVEHNSRPTL